MNLAPLLEIATLAQGFHIARRHRCRQGRQNADQWSALRLLRTRRERSRYRRAAEAAQTPGPSLSDGRVSAYDPMCMVRPCVAVTSGLMRRNKRRPRALETESLRESGWEKFRARWLLTLAPCRYCFAARRAARSVQRFGARDLRTFRAGFGARTRASCSRPATNARSAAAVGLRWRGMRAAAAGMGRRVSTLAKRRGVLMSLRRPTIR
jgi:hypothetical protein